MNLEAVTGLPIEIVRTRRRKTASIKIEDGSVRVIVPLRLSTARIEQLVQKRLSWIRHKLREQAEVVLPAPKEYVSGESFTYLGRNYRLKLLESNLSTVKLRGGRLELRRTEPEAVREALLGWYRAHALQRLTEKTRRYAKLLQVEPESVTVKDYKARWGACSSTGRITYNWRIIIAPHRIVDYVVVHELCHLKHMNHSPAYWRAVKHELPDYQERRVWLKSHSQELVV